MNNTENVIRKVQFDFDNEALGVLQANEEWKQHREKSEDVRKELKSKLKKIDPKLERELMQLEDLYTSLECIELEIYFSKGFKEGVKFILSCLG